MTRATSLLLPLLLATACATTGPGGGSHTLTIGADDAERERPDRTRGVATGGEGVATAGEALVISFLEAMIRDDDSITANASMRDHISPRYIAAHNLNDHKVDSYALNTFTILGVEPPFVLARISFIDESNGHVNWAHNLTFKIVQVNGHSGPVGDYFIEPSGTSSSYIKPWWAVESYVQ